jgi:hypothetical protein
MHQTPEMRRHEAGPTRSKDMDFPEVSDISELKYQDAYFFIMYALDWGKKEMGH